jgi:hypothetical protein
VDGKRADLIYMFFLTFTLSIFSKSCLKEYGRKPLLNT